jgi:hypothetical protein
MTFNLEQLTRLELSAGLLFLPFSDQEHDPSLPLTRALIDLFDTGAEKANSSGLCERAIPSIPGPGVLDLLCLTAFPLIRSGARFF